MVDVNVDDEKRKALIFHDKKTIIHISKKNGLWTNGFIIEVGNDFFIIKDRLTDESSIVLFSELENPIDIYKSKEMLE